MQARVFSRRKIETGLFFSLHHHPIGADVQITAVRIPGNDAVRRSGVAAAVQRPVLRDRQLVQVDLVSSQGVLIKAGFRRGNFARQRTVFELVFDPTNQFDYGRVRRLFQRQRDAWHARTKNVPQRARFVGTLLVSSKVVKNNRR